VIATSKFPFESAPQSPIMFCCSTVATAVNMFRDELFTECELTDLVLVVWLWEGGGTDLINHGMMRLQLFLRVVWRTDQGDVSGREQPSCCLHLSALCNFIFRISCEAWHLQYFHAGTAFKNRFQQLRCCVTSVGAVAQRRPACSAAVT
jgi:hypothetical protein